MVCTIAVDHVSPYHAGPEEWRRPTRAPGQPPWQRPRHSAPRSWAVDLLRVSFRLYDRLDTAHRELVCAVRMPAPSLHSNCEIDGAPRAALVVVSVDDAASKRGNRRTL